VLPICPCKGFQGDTSGSENGEWGELGCITRAKDVARVLGRPLTCGSCQGSETTHTGGREEVSKDAFGAFDQDPCLSLEAADNHTTKASLITKGEGECHRGVRVGRGGTVSPTTGALPTWFEDREGVTVCAAMVKELDFNDAMRSADDHQRSMVEEIGGEVRKPVLTLAKPTHLGGNAQGCE